jgi:hypothetical protein
VEWSGVEWSGVEWSGEERLAHLGTELAQHTRVGKALLGGCTQVGLGVALLLSLFGCLGRLLLAPLRLGLPGSSNRGRSKDGEHVHMLVGPGMVSI